METAIGLPKIRKGSIVFDLIQRKKTKVLTNPNSGELPDGLMITTGYNRMPHFVNYVLIYDESSLSMKCNNKPCRIRKANQVIPYKEYLKSIN